MSKRTLGQFYTKKNPFDCLPFHEWAERANTRYETILEPFAGSNDLIHHLLSLGLISRWQSYDIEPQDSEIIRQDTLEDFPKGFSVCITNPPWLAKNIAKFRGIHFPETEYDDLYKLALSKCLSHCRYVAALIPESFIRADIFQDRLETFISLTGELFDDTEHPVGMALFGATQSDTTTIFSGKNRVGTLSEIQSYRPPISTDRRIHFNDPLGNVGLIALDNTESASIRFCPVEEMGDYHVKQTGRHRTICVLPFNPQIDKYNIYLKKFRQDTQDVLLTSYRGLRRDGLYRRRLDWQLARDIIMFCEENP